MRTTPTGRLGALVCAAGLAITLGGCAAVPLLTRQDGRALVTAEELDRLGYERPETLFDPGLQRKALAHRDEIAAAVEAVVERTLDRDVRIVGIHAFYPYRSVDVSWRTVDEPVLAASELVGLEADGSVLGESAVATNQSWLAIESAVTEGVMHMAHRERVAEMNAYLSATYPELTARPPGMVEYWSGRDPVISLGFDHERLGEWPEVEASEQAVYQAYLEDRNRTDAEWREILERAGVGRGFALGVDLMLAEPGTELTEELARRVADDLRSNPLFAGFTSWRITTISNELLRGEIATPHQEIAVWTNERLVEWSVTHKVDGGHVG
jgi:hypothetical protein